eukprot:GHVP01000095.1.p1 GENE.GHVP01000095.1~~GHVP01000095.1.p1  ORF type:complete len:224 (-),score=79.23 GHVP01000095.1:8-679(-)
MEGENRSSDFGALHMFSASSLDESSGRKEKTAEREEMWNMADEERMEKEIEKDNDELCFPMAEEADEGVNKDEMEEEVPPATMLLQEERLFEEEKIKEDAKEEAVLLVEAPKEEAVLLVETPKEEAQPVEAPKEEAVLLVEAPKEEAHENMASPTEASKGEITPANENPKEEVDEGISKEKEEIRNDTKNDVEDSSHEANSAFKYEELPKKEKKPTFCFCFSF